MTSSKGIDLSTVARMHVVAHYTAVRDPFGASNLGSIEMGGRVAKCGEERPILTSTPDYLQPTGLIGGEGATPTK